MSDIKSATDRIRPMTVADATLVLEWRNHPDVRRGMFTQHEIGIEEHMEWFDRSVRDPSRHLLIYEKQDLPLAFVGLTVSGHSRVAEWGFHVAPGAAKGTGRAMGRHALDHAFDALALHKVCGRAIAYNQPSIGFHAAMGFRQEGVLRDQYFDGQRYHAVICFGLLENEWLAASGR
jgi:UDP-4-amino-4,6-dideoxy-N-acetyl-beta-L-altrosamine N-acetyltransferase